MLPIRTIVVWAALAMMVSAARADEESPPAAPRSDQLFKDALDAYDAGRYDEAMTLFSRVYANTQAPSLLFNMGQTARLMGDCPRAVAHYRRFIDEAATSPDRPRAEAWLVKLGGCEGSPSPSPIVAPPPSPAPSPAAVAVTLPRPAEARPEGRRKPPGRARVTGMILIGAAAASAGAGGAFAWRAAGDADQLSTWARDGNMWNDTAADIDRDGQRAELLSRVFLGTALVVAALGLVLVARGEPP